MTNLYLKNLQIIGLLTVNAYPWPAHMTPRSCHDARDTSLARYLKSVSAVMPAGFFGSLQNGVVDCIVVVVCNISGLPGLFW